MRTSSCRLGLLLASIVTLVCAGSSWAAEPAVVKLQLDKAAPGEKPIDVYLQLDGNKIVETLGLATAFNQAVHKVDAHKLQATPTGIGGTLAVILQPDHFQPADGKPRRLTLDLKVDIRDGKLTGTYKGHSTVEPHPQGSSAATPLEGQVRGTVGPPPELHKGLWLCRIYMDDAVGTQIGGKNAWGSRAFPNLVLKDGKVIQALVRGHGGRQINYFEAVVEKCALEWKHNAFSADLDVRQTKGVDYRYALRGTLIGDRAGGSFQKTLDGAGVPGSRFWAVFEPLIVPPRDDAIYVLELHKAVDGNKELLLFLRARQGKFMAGLGYAGTFNHNYHDCDPTELKLEGDRLRGKLSVTINPDAYVPKDKRPIACEYDVDAKLADGCLQGKFTGKFGDQAANGIVLGRLEPVPAAPEPAHYSIKLEDGVVEGATWFRRVYVGFTAEAGKAKKGHISNNKGGYTGTFKAAQVDFDGYNFKGTVEFTVDTSKGPKTGAYRCVLSGRAIGRELFGKVDVYYEGELRKQGTTFMGSVGPAK